MKNAIFATLAATALTLPQLAVAEAQIDADGDGQLSVEELRAVYPEVSEDMFKALDTDADGQLNEEEFAAGQDAGLLPKSEG